MLYRSLVLHLWSIPAFVRISSISCAAPYCSYFLSILFLLLLLLLNTIYILIYIYIVVVLVNRPLSLNHCQTHISVKMYIKTNAFLVGCRTSLCSPLQKIYKFPMEINISHFADLYKFDQQSRITHISNEF